MTDRAGIIVYLDGDPIDIIGFEGWRPEKTFFDAFVQGALFKDCKTAEQYCALISEALPDFDIPSKDEVDDFINICDYCYTVDLNSGYVYRGPGVLTAFELRKMEEGRGVMAAQMSPHFDDLLDNKRKISFLGEGVQKALELIPTSTRLEDMLSARTLKILRHRLGFDD
ncbi:MAG: hypothetical protein IJJ14_01410 [Coriobacteriales bacterium]|nr:hypothetical protein [Coriobacteriales bacterium]MBQ6586594.1 hypothetical protein [Coriobacteriales bacterium]